MNIEIQLNNHELILQSNKELIAETFRKGLLNAFILIGLGFFILTMGLISGNSTSRINGHTTFFNLNLMTAYGSVTILYALFIWRNIFKRQKLYYRELAMNTEKLLENGGVITITIDDDRVSYLSADSTISFAWTSLKSYQQTKNLYIINQSNLGTGPFAIPKSALTENQQVDFEAFLSRHLKLKR